MSWFHPNVKSVNDFDRIKHNVVHKNFHIFADVIYGVQNTLLMTSDFSHFQSPSAILSCELYGGKNIKFKRGYSSKKGRIGLACNGYGHYLKLSRFYQSGRPPELAWGFLKTLQQCILHLRTKWSCQSHDLPRQVISRHDAYLLFEWCAAALWQTKSAIKLDNHESCSHPQTVSDLFRHYRNFLTLEKFLRQILFVFLHQQLLRYKLVSYSSCPTGA